MLAALVVGGVGWLSFGGSGDRPVAIRDDQRPPRGAVAALGRVIPVSEVIRLGTAEPNRLDSLLVERGQLVTKGQVLARLSTYNLHIADRERLRARIEESRAQLTAETALGLAKVQNAELRLRQAVDVAPHDLAAQEATVAALESELANNRDILTSVGELRRNEISSRRSHDNQAALVHQGAARLRAAKAQLSAMARRQKLEVETAQADLERSRAELARAQAAIPLASLERELQLVEAKADLSSLISPLDGRVLNVLARPGDDVSNRPVLTLGDTSVMRVVAEIYETDIHAVRVGQLASIKSPALPHPLSGRVIEVGHLIYKNDVLSVDPAARTDARVVEVRIELDDGAAVREMTNLTVDAVIQTAATGTVR